VVVWMLLFVISFFGRFGYMSSLFGCEEVDCAMSGVRGCWWGILGRGLL